MQGEMLTPPDAGVRAPAPAPTAWFAMIKQFTTCGLESYLLATPPPQAALLLVNVHEMSLGVPPVIAQKPPPYEWLVISLLVKVVAVTAGEAYELHIPAPNASDSTEPAASFSVMMQL